MSQRDDRRGYLASRYPIHALKVRAAEKGTTAAQVVLDALKHAGVL